MKGGKKSIPVKTIWKDRTGSAWRFLCAHCKAERRLPVRPTPGGSVYFVRILITTFFLMIITWPLFEWKGVTLFFPVWAAFDFYHRLYVRSLMKCPFCGFDPYLYMVDVNLARQKVDEFYRKRFEERGIPYPKDVERKEAQPVAEEKEAVADGGA